MPGATFSVNNSSVVEQFSQVFKPMVQNKMANITLNQNISAGQDLVINFNKVMPTCEIYFVPDLGRAPLTEQDTADVSPLTEKLTEADTVSGGNLSFTITQLVSSSSIVIPKEELQSIRSKWLHDAPYHIVFSGFNAIDTLHMKNKFDATTQYNLPVYLDASQSIRVNLQQ